MNESTYNIDFKIFAKMFTAILLQRPKLLAIVGALLSPVKALHYAFLQFRQEAIYKVSHNASVGLLEKMLNDKFDPAQRRIYINNVQRQDDLRVYTFPQQREINVSTSPKVGIRSGTTFNAENPDFKVYLPEDIQPIGTVEQEGLVIRIKAQLDYYKLFAKKYTLIWIN